MARICTFLVLLLAVTRTFAGVDPGTSAGVAGSEFVYVIRRGDTLTSISSRFGVSEQVLARANALRAPFRLKPGNRLRVDNRHLIPEVLPEGILINIPQRMLFFFRDAKLEAAYPVALGRRDWETPTGDFSVTHLERNKTWCVPPSIQEEMRRAGKPVVKRVPPGPDNPLGEYWIGLSVPGYGIHATIAPTSIYRMRTHGCIRLHPEDAAALYAQISVELPVKIIYLPVLLAKLGDGRVLAEVNPDVYNRGGDPMSVLRDVARQQGIEEEVDWSVIREMVRAKDGHARESGKAASGAKGFRDRGFSAGFEPGSTALHQAWRISCARRACAADRVREHGDEAGSRKGLVVLQHAHR